MVVRAGSDARVAPAAQTRLHGCLHRPCLLRSRRLTRRPTGQRSRRQRLGALRRGHREQRRRTQQQPGRCAGAGAKRCGQHKTASLATAIGSGASATTSAWAQGRPDSGATSGQPSATQASIRPALRRRPPATAPGSLLVGAALPVFAQRPAVLRAALALLALLALAWVGVGWFCRAWARPPLISGLDRVQHRCCKLFGSGPLSACLSREQGGWFRCFSTYQIGRAFRRKKPATSISAR